MRLVLEWYLRTDFDAVIIAPDISVQNTSWKTYITPATVQLYAGYPTFRPYKENNKVKIQVLGLFTQ